jgi:ABC-type transporter Mla maintaining outer membrane lipid asymmetry ATPase subunit MlaF
VSVVLAVTGITKDYRGLRPLRLQQLNVEAGERVALVGFDRTAAEVFVSLATGAALPDTGQVDVFGRATAAITDPDDWLRLTDRFGIVSERAVLLDTLTPLQNLAMPFTLDVEPLRGDARRQAEQLAVEIGVPAESWEAALGTAPAAVRVRVRLGRALAHGPEVLLLEHASAGLDAAESLQLGEAIRKVAESRRLAAIAMTVDEAFAGAVASRVLHWEAATGRLSARRGWFGRLLG